MNQKTTLEALIILSIIAIVIIILAAIYSINSFRRMSIAYKKLDYLIEDLTYKSEMLNTTVETITKMSNYLDSFEVVAHKNVKAGVKLVARNKDLFYDLAERARTLATEQAAKGKKTKKTTKKTTTTKKTATTKKNTTKKTAAKRGKK